MANSVKENRNSKIELLRIIAMFLIVVNHSVSHGIFENYSFGVEDVSWQLCFSYFFSHFGDIGNGIFMLLTGYFSYKNSRENINYKAISDLIIKMSFYSIGIFCILSLVGNYSFSLIDTVISFFPYLFGLNWYLCCYIIILFFVPFFIKIIKSLDEKIMYSGLVLLFVLKLILPLLKISTYMPYAHDFYHFAYMFFVGASICRCIEGGGTNFNTRRLFMLTVFCFVLMILSSFAIPYMAVVINNENVLSMRTYMRSFVVNIIPILIVTLTVSTKAFRNRFINRIAISVPTIYLLHDNKFLRAILWHENYNMFHKQSYLIYLIGICFVVFVSCIIVDIIVRNSLKKPKEKAMRVVLCIIDFIADAYKKVIEKVCNYFVR